MNVQNAIYGLVHFPVSRHEYQRPTDVGQCPPSTHCQRARRGENSALECLRSVSAIVPAVLIWHGLRNIDHQLVVCQEPWGACRRKRPNLTGFEYDTAGFFQLAKDCGGSFDVESPSASRGCPTRNHLMSFIEMGKYTTGAVSGGFVSGPAAKLVISSRPSTVIVGPCMRYIGCVQLGFRIMSADVLPIGRHEFSRRSTSTTGIGRINFSFIWRKSHREEWTGRMDSKCDRGGHRVRP